jgi:hypothetical protein
LSAGAPCGPLNRRPDRSTSGGRNPDELDRQQPHRQAHPAIGELTRSAAVRHRRRFTSNAPEADARALSFHIRTLRAEDFPPLLAAVAAPSGTAVIDHPPASPADVLKLFHPNSKIT